MIKTQPGLILIDVQRGFSDPYWGVRNNPDAEENMGLLLRFWRNHGAPVYHVQHLSLDPKSPLRAGLPGVEFHEVVKPLPHERIFKKHVNSGFIGTDLEKTLRESKCNDVIIVGLTTDHCVSTTTRMAANLGFNVKLIHDACATFNRKNFDGEVFSAAQIHNTALASLNKEFARITDTKSIMKEGL